MKLLLTLLICFVYGAQALGNSGLIQRLTTGEMLSKVDNTTMTAVANAISKAVSLMSLKDDNVIRWCGLFGEPLSTLHKLATDFDKLPAAQRKLPEYMRDEKGFKYNILEHPLHTAVAGGNYGEALRLLALGKVGVNDFDSKGRAPLHIAVEVGDIQMVALLILHGAEVNIGIAKQWWHYRVVDHDEAGLEHYAPDEVFLLLPVDGSDPTKVKIKEVQNNNRDAYLTPVHLAADGEHLDILALLLLEGASTQPFTISDQEKYINPDHGKVLSAARIAARKGNLASIVLLDAAEYNLEIETKFDLGYPFHLASANNQQNIVAYLLDKMPEARLLYNLHYMQNVEMFEHILAKITIPIGDIRSPSGNDLLKSAVIENNVQIVKLLIDKYNLNPNNARDDLHDNLHSLVYALESGKEELLTALLERGADPLSYAGPVYDAKGKHKTVFEVARERGRGHLFVPYLKEGTPIPEDVAQSVARQKEQAKYAP